MNSVPRTILDVCLVWHLVGQVLVPKVVLNLATTVYVIINTEDD